MADYRSSSRRTQWSRSAAWISFQDAQSHRSSVCSRCAQRCSWFFTLFWSKRWEGPSKHIHVARQVGSYPTCFLNISLDWQSSAPSIMAPRMFQVPVFCSESQEPTFPLEFSAVNDNLTALHSFQFDNLYIKTFAKDKRNKKGSKEKNYIGSPWRVLFSSIRSSWQPVIRQLSREDTH